MQSAGHGYRLKGNLLKTEFERGGPIQHLLLRYTQALIGQMAQTAVCNRYHSIDQQLCCWLLLSLGRLPANELTMTQELIHYSRGHISVLDRSKLEARVCECYAVVRRKYDRLLPDSMAT